MTVFHAKEQFERDMMSLNQTRRNNDGEEEYVIEITDNNDPLDILLAEELVIEMLLAEKH
jgi:hypothetical protein